MTRYFTQDHEWIDVDGDLGTVGITDYAQGQLGDITYVELPAEGQDVKQGDSVSVVDSVKAASDVYTPVSGTVSAVNGELDGAPELVNSDADGAGTRRVKHQPDRVRARFRSSHGVRGGREPADFDFHAHGWAARCGEEWSEGKRRWRQRLISRPLRCA